MNPGAGYVERVGEDPVALSFSYCATRAICKAGHLAHCVKQQQLNFYRGKNLYSFDKSFLGRGLMFTELSLASPALRTSLL